jgi:hypothetical protein
VISPTVAPATGTLGCTVTVLNWATSVPVGGAFPDPLIFFQLLLSVQVLFFVPVHSKVAAEAV